ncbi:hypothetical protein QNI16_10145 [Cytophagaceae bacterium YF14B1]|uniref:Uncharacterized protein n=1 Tax=Xanthocytophaga flava TaxID=3048013 RepID=A0AAE3U855_9BACT|nr:hypothetical protein [Xanthocytophaga flavus]MDJ1480843.1 hypothetical protein [Xanthocytophaga flavus]
MLHSTTHEKRILLEEILTEIESIETGTIDSDSMLDIINRAQIVIASATSPLLRERAIENLSRTKEKMFNYQKSKSSSTPDLLEITSSVYVTIEAFLWMSPFG